MVSTWRGCACECESWWRAHGLRWRWRRARHGEEWRPRELATSTPLHHSTYLSRRLYKTSRALLMAEVQALLPTQSVPSAAQSSSADKDALITRLDALLEQYLSTLDQYEQLTTQLSAHLSSVSAPFRTAPSLLLIAPRATSRSPRQTSTTARARATDRMATTNACRQHGGCTFPTL